MSVLRFESVSKQYPGGHPALVDVSFQVEEGEMLFVTGHSGAGKSTLLKLIHLSERPSRGAVVFNDHNLLRVRGGKVALHRRQVGVVYQDHRLLTDRSIGENVALPLILRGTRRAEIGKRVRSVLERMGLVNTMAGALVPWLASVFGIFLVRQYAQSIPDELLEAARMDGAGEWRIFTLVVLPLLRPVIVTLAVLTFLGAWNDFMWPLIVLTDRELQTLPVALAGLSREHVQDIELMMAGAVLTVAPVLLLFLALQRHYLQGLLSGSVKG